MNETNTEITWPSKLKIGAKSKKGNLFFKWEIFSVKLRISSFSLKRGNFL